MSTDGGGGGKKAGRPLAITSAVKETETKRERESQNGWGWRLSGNKFQVISMGQDGRFLWLSSSYVLRLGRTSFSSNLLLSLLFGFLSASRRVLQYILLCQHQSPIQILHVLLLFFASCLTGPALGSLTLRSLPPKSSRFGSRAQKMTSRHQKK